LEFVGSQQLPHLLHSVHGGEEIGIYDLKRCCSMAMPTSDFHGIFDMRNNPRVEKIWRFMGFLDILNSRKSPTNQKMSEN